jgi:hypothetical protein
MSDIYAVLIGLGVGILTSIPLAFLVIIYRMQRERRR